MAPRILPFHHPSAPVQRRSQLMPHRPPDRLAAAVGHANHLGALLSLIAQLPPAEVWRLMRQLAAQAVTRRQEHER